MRRDCPGKILRRRREGNRLPNFVWPGLTRSPTALSGLDKDVDARIKSAQDAVKLFFIRAIAPYQAITIAVDPSSVTRWGQSGKSDVLSLRILPSGPI
jgi:hypothetical protein